VEEGRAKGTTAKEGGKASERERVHNLCVFAERRIVSRRAIRGISWAPRKTNVKSVGEKEGNDD